MPVAAGRRAVGRAARGRSAPEPGRAARRPWRAPAFPERGVAAAVRVLLGLVVLTPLVVDFGVAYPFVVGKAVWSRTLIALAFALWAVLALARPAWRPPRSALLVLLAAFGAVAVIAGLFGVSPLRSTWSYYARMGGLFDLAHWLAFTVVAASVLRSRRDWAWMLAVGLAAGALAAASALAQALAPGLLPLPALRGAAKASGTLGNAAYLGGCAQATALLAAGGIAAILARGREDVRTGWRPAALLGAAGALALALLALAWSGSMGATVGLAAGSLAVLAVWAAGAGRRAAWATAVAVALPAAAFAGLLTWRMADPANRVGLPTLDRLTSPYALRHSLGSRLVNWQAGTDAFAARPLLGWGPENYVVASGRFLPADYAQGLPGLGLANEGLDRAHNMLIEEAATKGLPGLAAYLALWGATAVVVVRRTRRGERADRIMAACVAGALLGWFVHSQTLFYSAASWLVHAALLAWLVRAGAGYAPTGPPAVAAAPGAVRRALRVAGGLAAALAATASIAANAAMYAGAAALHRAETGPPERFMPELAEAILAFPPLATHVRIVLFENLAQNWTVLRTRYPREAFRLLGWARTEEPAALAAEPASWQLHHALAHLYGEVAKTEPEYAPDAARFDASARAATPNLDPGLPMAAPAGARRGRGR